LSLVVAWWLGRKTLSARGAAEKPSAMEWATAIVAAINAIAEGGVNVVPDVLVTGGGGGIEGLAATLIKRLGSGASVTTADLSDSAEELPTK